MSKQKVTVHLSVWFQDMDIVSPEEALDTVKLVLQELRHKCEDELSVALEDIGARAVKIEMVAF